MIDNHYMDEFGTIHQINKKPFKYDKQYIQNGYLNNPQYEKNATILNSLRLGFTISANGGRLPKSILDIGYGNGDFLKLNLLYNCNVFGYDISNIKIDNIDTLEDIDDVLNNEYEVITMFDSFEHFDTLDWVSKLNSKIIVISVPWCHYTDILNEYDEKIADEWMLNWKHLKKDEHLHYFSKQSLIQFMESCGYTNIISSNIEDIVRKPTTSRQNILTCAFT